MLLIVDEGRRCWNLLAIKTKARTVVVGRGEKCPLNDAGFELHVLFILTAAVGREKGKEKCEDITRRGEQLEEKKRKIMKELKEDVSI